MLRLPMAATDKSQWTMLCALFVFEVGSAICGSAVTSVMFIIGRAVSGVGSAGLMNGALTIILGAIRPEVRPCEWHSSRQNE
jgi:MFS family permease